MLVHLRWCDIGNMQRSHHDSAEYPFEFWNIVVLISILITAFLRSDVQQVLRRIDRVRVQLRKFIFNDDENVRIFDHITSCLELVHFLFFNFLSFECARFCLDFNSFANDFQFDKRLQNSQNQLPKCIDFDVHHVYTTAWCRLDLTLVIWLNMLSSWATKLCLHLCCFSICKCLWSLCHVGFCCRKLLLEEKKTPNINRIWQMIMKSIDFRSNLG